MLPKSNESVDKIIREFQSLGITISQEVIEERRKKLNEKLKLMKDLKKDGPEHKDAMKKLVNISLEENKIVFDRLAQL